MLPGGTSLKGRMFSNDVVVIEIIHSFKEEVLCKEWKAIWGYKTPRHRYDGNVQLRAFSWGSWCWFWMIEQPNRKEFSKFNELEPGFAAKLFTPIHCKDNRHRDTVTSEPGKHPQKEGQSIVQLF